MANACGELALVFSNLVIILIRLLGLRIYFVYIGLVSFFKLRLRGTPVLNFGFIQWYITP